MALSESILQTYSIQTAIAAITAETFVDADGAQCAAGEVPLGVNARTVAIGDEQLINTIGTLVRVTAGAAITADAQIEVGAAGAGITLAAGKACGYAVTSASGIGVTFLARIPY